MAGHSKFKNIMHRKGRQDAKRAKIFAKLGKELAVAARGGTDPDFNPGLRLAILAAKAQNMPNDNIQRAINRAEGDDSIIYEEVRYEGYGPGGVAIIAEAMTNNKNRTAAEIRSTFSKYGGNLGETGSVSFGFKRLGSITIDIKLAKEDELFEFIVENGSEDFEVNQEEYQIYCNQDELHNLNEKILKKFGQTNSSELIWKSGNNINVEKEVAEKLFKLLNVLEENDDVQIVSSNFEVSDEILSSLTI